MPVSPPDYAQQLFHTFSPNCSYLCLDFLAIATMHWSIVLSFVSLTVTASAQGYLGGDQNSCSNRDAFVYGGCYSDTENGLHGNLTWLLSSDPNSVLFYPSYDGRITVEVCTKACRGHGLRVAALHNGTSCFCGTTFPISGAQASIDHHVRSFNRKNIGKSTLISSRVSGLKCAGDSTEYCGSSNATDIYFDPSFSNSSSAGAGSNFDYLGCFTSIVPGPLYVVLEKPAASDCAYYCGQLGYPFMGQSEYNSETGTKTCGCGSEIQSGNQVDDSHCNYYCNGSTNAV